MGSSYFFNKFEDYVQKDADELCIMDSFPFNGINVLNMKKDGKDVFFYRNMDKDAFIEDTISSKVPMRVGKFLIKEFSEHLGMVPNDLKALDHMFEGLDEKHTYEKIIYDAYLENGEFRLTDDQIDAAYREYKRMRPDIYEKEIE